MKKEETILLLNEKTDLLACEVSCPSSSCPSHGKKYVYGVPYVIAKCNKCGATYKTDFSQNIYTKKARQLNSMLYKRNKVVIIASEKYENDLMCIKEHFNGFNNWEVSEVTQSTEEIKVCRKCGICQNCFTCMDCGKSYERNPERRKQVCPHCGSARFTNTFVKEVRLTDNEKIRVCPHCNSTRVKMTRTTNKTRCHKCGSRKLSEKHVNLLYRLDIKRKRAYRQEE